MYGETNMNRKTLNWRTRGAVMARSYHRHDDSFICNWCCARLSASEVVIDHIEPLARGGNDDLENLTVACVQCNLIKSDAPPDVAEERINARFWL